MPIHIRASKQDLAPYVLLPGDPDRTTYIAKNFLSKPQQYTDYRQMFGYTGDYKGIKVSIQTSGMGTPSASIMINELFELGVQAITRVGTVGGLQKTMQLADLIMVQSAWASREIVGQITQSADFVPTASWDLLEANVQQAKKRSSLKYHVGSVASTNLFYNPNPEFNKTLIRLGCLGCEMEAAALFALASVNNKQASCLLTVSDLIHGEPEDFVRASDDKISEGVDKMVEIALDSFVDLNNKTN